MNLLNWKNIKFGTKVLVSDDGSKWFEGKFIEYTSNGLRPFLVETKELGLSLYRYCKLECMVDYDCSIESDDEVKFMYKMFGYLGKDDFKRLIEIISECENRESSLSRCSLNCYDCMFKRLLEYEEATYGNR